MKNKWGFRGIKTNGDALLAFLVSYGADLNAHNCENMTQREMVLDINPSILPVLTQIQAETGRDIARLGSMVNRPLRTVTKVASSLETEVIPSSFVDPFLEEAGLKKPMAGDLTYPGRVPSGRRRRGPRKRFRNAEQSTTRDGPGSKSKETISMNDELHQLRDDLLEKDEEMDFLLSRMKILQHLVKKRISFTCGHDVTRSIADLSPNCPLCRKPITSVTDLE
nr:uncharacterized protein LOC129281810 [Lytechinus pictus]